MNVLMLGNIVATANATNQLTPDEMAVAIRRHRLCDWGDVCEEDKGINDAALRNGERILSVYRSAKGEKFWIITERDRSVTTVLMPEDY